MIDFNPDFEGADFEKDMLLPIITAIAEEKESQSKQACWTGEPGKLHVEKLLNYGHEVRIYKILRMHLTTFYAIRICVGVCTQIRVDFVMNNTRQNAKYCTSICIFKVTLQAYKCNGFVLGNSEPPVKDQF